MNEDRLAAYRVELDRRATEASRRQAEIDAQRAARVAARPVQKPIPAPVTPPPPITPADIEAQARREYELSTALPAEFGSVEVYLAYRRASAAGRIKIFGVPKP